LPVPAAGFYFTSFFALIFSHSLTFFYLALLFEAGICFCLFTAGCVDFTGAIAFFCRMAIRFWLSSSWLWPVQ
jgi:hypothetical protein